VQLTVTDSGTGMTQEVLERAFEPFFTTKPTGVGTGLGLATVYGIAKQAGGRASIYSELGRGTSIRVLLPATGERAATTAPSENARASAPRGGTILVVEDEPLIRAAAQRILAAAGYIVLQVGRPDEALEVMKDRNDPIDLLVTDMVMPGMSGRELAGRLRAHRPSLRVLYMTGYSEELVGRRGELDGPLLQKPFTREPLLAAVAAALGPSS
jgi:CheY-like chemotaxis protein